MTDLIGGSITRKFLLAAIVAAFATSPMGVQADTLDECEWREQAGGLFCNDGNDILYCENDDGTCTVSCGEGEVEMSCIED